MRLVLLGLLAALSFSTAVEAQTDDQSEVMRGVLTRIEQQLQNTNRLLNQMNTNVTSELGSQTAAIGRLESAIAAQTSALAALAQAVAELRTPRSDIQIMLEGSQYLQCYRTECETAANQYCQGQGYHHALITGYQSAGADNPNVTSLICIATR